MRPTDEHYRTAEQNGISRRNVYQRWYYYGYEIERAITEPLKTYSSVWPKWKEVCQANGISNECFTVRIKKGMPPEEAATMPKQWKKREEERKMINIEHLNAVAEITEMMYKATHGEDE